MHCALSTVNTRAIEVDWHLEWAHRVLFVTAFAVSPDAGRLVALEHLKQALACVASHASGDTIGWHAVDPDDLVRHLDATIGSGRSQSVTSSEHARESSCVAVKGQYRRGMGYKRVAYLEPSWSCEAGSSSSAVACRPCLSTRTFLFLLFT